MIQRSRLAADSLLNLAGSGLPIIAALPLLGILARQLDPARFGLVLLAWAVIGYAGVLDLGLSRAVTIVVASSQGQAARRQQILATALAAAIIVGACAGGLIGALAEPIVRLLMVGDSDLNAEAVAGFRSVGVTVALLLPYLVLQGYWEGIEAFRDANIMRIASGVVPLALATLAAMFHADFAAAMVGALSGRALVLALAFSRIGVRGFIGTVPDVRTAKELFRYGGWVTISGVISPAMSYLDRFIVGFARGPLISGFYAAPVDIALKLLLLPQSVTRSLLPKLLAASDASDWAGLSRQAYGLVAFVCLPVAATGALLAEPILNIWLGKVYSDHASPALRILMLGFVLCSLAQVPFTEICGRKRFALAAALQAMAIAPAIALTYWLSRRLGAEGAAIAWTVRAGAELLVYFVVARRLSRVARCPEITLRVAVAGDRR